MSRHAIWTNFTGGEITPRLGGRMDLKRFNSSCEVLENFRCTPHGPVIRRAGTRFVAKARYSDKRAILLPFIYSTEQPYVLEVGDKYIRFFKNSGQIFVGPSPQEVTTPYLEAHVFELKTAQSADRLYWAHQKYEPRKLDRRKYPTPPPAEDWTLEVIDFQPPPTYVEDTRIDDTTTLVLNAQTGLNVPVVGSASIFLPGDMDRELLEVDGDGLPFGGTGIISGLDSAPYPQSNIQIDITRDFTTKTLGTAWRLGGTPTVDLTPDKRGPVGAIIKLTVAPEIPPTAPVPSLAGVGAGSVNNGAHRYKVTFVTSTGETSGGTDSVSVTTAAGDGQVVLRSIAKGSSRVIQRRVYRTVAGGSEYKLLTSIGDNITTEFHDNIADASLTDTIPTLNTAAIPAFRTSDVGKYVVINDGVVKLTKFLSTTEMQGIILARLNSTAAAISGLWTMEVSTWNATRGFPGSVALFAQRLVWAGSLKEPQHIWPSVVGNGEYENYSRGTEADDAIVAEMATNEVNVIRWLIPMKTLMIGTTSGEFKMRGATDQALTPTNRQIDPETAHGSGDISAIRIGSAAIFVQRSGRKVRELAYNLEADSYVATDLLTFAEHLGRRYGIVQMAYQRDPDPILWCVREDGTLLGLTYEKSQEVFAWHRHITGARGKDIFSQPVPVDGFVESACVIPHPDGDRDQVWLLIRRAINGATERYIEFMDDKGNPYPLYEYLNTDSALTYDGLIDTVTVTLSNAAVGSGRTITSSGSFWLSSDVGAEVWHPSGRGHGAARITGYTSPTEVTAEVTIPFDAVGPLANWFLAIDTASGLGHLEGKTVAMVGDGAVYPEMTVVAGECTWEPHAARVEIGLPYSSVLKPMRPEVEDGRGTSQGRKKHWADIRVRLTDTLGCSVNGEQIPFRSSGDVMDEPPPLQNTDVELSNLDYDDDGYVEVRQDQPLPCTVVCIFGVINVGDK